MIREEGRVINYQEGLVKVHIDAKASCNSCKLCNRGNEGMTMDVDVNTPFTQGDKIYLEIEGRNLILCFFVLYLFPVISFILGILFGMIAAEILSYEKYREPFEIIFGFIFFVISLFCVIYFDKRYKEKVKINIKLKKKE